MLTLVLDTATAAVTAALASVAPDGTASIVAQRVTVDARAHDGLSAVVAGVGPGPFTGLRVGLVTAAALGDTLGIPVYGVCTLDALGWVATTAPGRVLVATDARRHEVYWAVYAAGARLSGPAVNRPSDVDTAGVVCALGDGALRYADVLGVPVRDEPRHPPALGLVSLAAARVLDRAPAEPLTPLYLRRPDAVAPGARKPALP